MSCRGERCSRLSPCRSWPFPVGWKLISWRAPCGLRAGWLSRQLLGLVICHRGGIGRIGEQAAFPGVRDTLRMSFLAVCSLNYCDILGCTALGPSRWTSFPTSPETREEPNTGRIKLNPFTLKNGQLIDGPRPGSSR